MQNRSLRRVFAAILSLSLLLALSIPAAATSGTQNLQANYNHIKVMLDGKYLVLTDNNGNTVEPFAVAGTTYLPLRAVSGALGLNVEWDQATGTVVLTSGAENTTETTRIPPQGTFVTRTITVNYNNYKVTLDGKELALTDATGKTVEPFAMDGTTYLPIRAISNALGLEVSWDGDSQTVYLSTEPFVPSEDEVTFYVEGMLNEMYLNKYDTAYLTFMGLTADEADATYLNNILIESDFFCRYWGIVEEDRGESYDTLDANLRNQINELYKEIYSHSKFTVSPAVQQANGNYTVEVKVSPINIMKLANETYSSGTYKPLEDFWNSSNNSDQVQYGQIIIDMVKAQLDKIDNLPEQTVTLRVEKTENASFSINSNDLNALDILIIDYDYD